MRVLVLTQWYPPEPALLMEELAHSLDGLGHKVTVLTGFPNYPSGRIYAGYRLRLWDKQRTGAVTLVRVALYPDHSQSAIKRVANYVSFAFSASLLAPLLVSRPDVMFVYHPPLTVGLAAAWLSRFWRVPFVYQIQDLWPETLTATGMVKSRWALSVIDRSARWIYARADAICVISEGFRVNLIAKGVIRNKVNVISNWVDTSVYHPETPDLDLADALKLRGRFNVMFAGNIGEAQGLETVLQAAALLRDIDQIQFVFVGDGTALSRLQEIARSHQLSNVRFLGRYPPSDMPRIYALTDILLLHLKDDPLFRLTIPHKMFAYMASGKPILAALAGDGAKVVSDVKAGLVCEPEDANALAATVRQFHRLSASELRIMAQNGLDASREQFSRERLVRRIESLLKDVLRQASSLPETRPS